MMKLETSKWKTLVLYVALLLSGTTLEAQEAQRDTCKLEKGGITKPQKDVETLQQDVEALQQEVKVLQQEVRNLQSLMQGQYTFPGRENGGLLSEHRFIHRLGVEARPQIVFPTNPFLQGENERWKPIHNSIAAHLRYSFQFRPNTCADRIYGGAYQGLGVSYQTFGDKKQLGDPLTFYVFQGARIARFHPRLSLNYEWNFGISSGWQPYDNLYNAYNGAIGSRMNAYINAGVYLNWTLSRYFDFNAGVDLTHFSNGNTKFPNVGINTGGLKIGVVYNFNREKSDISKTLYTVPIPRFPRHVSYDLVLFGSWRRKGVFVGEKQFASPNAYPVAGFNFAPMYNVGYKFRFGLSVDGVFDGSANVYAQDMIVSQGNHTYPYQFFRPSIDHQLALGLSGRAEYVMPYFTIGVGMGTNVMGKGDLKGFYQTLALKIHITRSSFLHIGYNLQNFKTPNYLMLGLGFRFNNKYPQVRH